MPDSDLSTLNDGERTALVLLAQGHTAKSIAQVTGRSVTSVNERLREARRKTGIGSSRELARLLAAQENRDKQIGVVTHGDAGAASAPEAAAHLAGGQSRKGILAMTLLIAGGAAAFALLFQSVPQTAPAPDPLLDGVLGSVDKTPPKLHEQLRLEPRDPAWAPAIEATLRTRYARVPRISGGDALRVVCGTTLCEVTGLINGGSNREIDATMQILQGKAMTTEIRTLGFTDSPSMSFIGAGKTQSRFVIYWVRDKSG